MKRLVVLGSIVWLGACSFKGHSGDDPVTIGDDDPAPPEDAPIAVTPDAEVVPDAPSEPTPDAPVPPPTVMYAASGVDLYALDLVAKTSTKIGTVATASLDGLAYNGSSLIGLDEGGTTMLVIDPATAAITATKPLDQTGVFGMTVIPVGELGGNTSPIPIVSDENGLYKIETGGHVVALSTYEDGYTFATDLAWVRGHGLYVTLRTQTSGGGTGTDLVHVDVTTGATLDVVGHGYVNVQGLSGFGGGLKAVSKGGYVYAVDVTTGMSSVVMMGGPMYTEAAQ